MRLLILCLSVLSLFAGSVSETLGQAQRKKKGNSQLVKKKKGKRKKMKNVDFCLVQLTEGIKGKIVEFKGNLMPSPDRPAPTRIPVKRKIAAFELTTLEQVENGKQTGFYSKIFTKKIEEVLSNEKGCFTMTLEPGRYSLFVWENGEWYANGFGGNGEIFEVEVKEKEVTEIQFSINHSAVY